MNGQADSDQEVDRALREWRALVDRITQEQALVSSLSDYREQGFLHLWCSGGQQTRSLSPEATAQALRSSIHDGHDDSVSTLPKANPRQA